ncbi:MAG TPA: hypothetical protein IAB83_00690 [Candidatus Faecousia faecavium]|nr:hypothetical protein [Candidatus Faecousia faecavium]
MKKTITSICAVLTAAMLVLPVSAAKYTPSVTQKGAPTAAAFTPSVQQKGAPTVEQTGVRVTALVDLSKAPKEVQETVEEAYKVIAEAESLEEAVPTLADVLKEMDTDLTAEDLVVRDLFYLELEKELEETLEKEKEVAVTFEVEGMEKDDFLMVMVFVDGEWVIVDAENVEFSEDEEVTVTFEAVGPIAFVTEKD